MSGMLSRMPTVAPAGVAVLFLVTLAAPAHAITRIRADQNSCATLQRTLDREGAAVIRWPSTKIANYFLYDRYVGLSYICPVDEVLTPATVPAADNPRCLVYRCERPEPIFNYQDD